MKGVKEEGRSGKAKGSLIVRQLWLFVRHTRSYNVALRLAGCFQDCRCCPKIEVIPFRFALFALGGFLKPYLNRNREKG